uniref:polyribonucleotide nucleotidyltransferase n=1 Tax=Chenopodium quinoa TaxID=63459 RepID=A0A803MP82_CHEQI
MSSVLSSDGEQDPDVMAANATSAALMLSDIPWGGPIGMIRIGRINGQFIINPTMDEAVKYLEPQIRLASKAGKQKKEYRLSMMPETTMEKIRKLSESRIEAIFSDPTYGKFERGEALDQITQDVKKSLEEECDEESIQGLSKAVDTVRKQIVRRRILKEGARVDGRRLDEVRPVYCESGNLPALHGSSLFSRGDTQVLCTVTLGAPGDAQHLESVVGPSSKRFMLHYSFPPFSINEVGKRAGLNRREVGHGTLAEKALLAVLPPEHDFPYTVRVNSEVMASDGSTSMASVCGGSMALMDAGIPVREHVAGVSVGLVSEVDPITGMITDYRILTDILGLEDHLGDMDFKISGTRNGITAIQLDIKPAGIPLDIICESLDPAFRGRLQILDHMQRAINAPRTEDDRNSPRLATLKYHNDSIRRLVGPLGALKKRIEEETGRDIEVGKVYKGIVTSIKEYGAFVEFNGGQQGLLHKSELSHEPVSRVSDVVSIGQQLSLMCIEQDVRGNIKLSLKANKSSSADKGFAGTKKGASQVWASIGDKTNGQEKNSGKKDPVVTKYAAVEVATSAVSDSSFFIRSVAECDEEEEKLATLSQNKTLGTFASSDQLILDQSVNDSGGAKSASLNKVCKDKKSELGSGICAKDLKFGTVVTAKVYQIRTRGLVLDLGGGLKGMYRYEASMST